MGRGWGRDEKRQCRPGVTKGWIWIWRVVQRGRRGWKDRRLVEQLASRQWHSGWQEPYNLLPSPLSLLLPRYPLSIHLRFLCVYTRMPYSAGKRNRHALPLIRISAGRLQCSPAYPVAFADIPRFFLIRAILFPFLLSVVVNYFLIRGVEWKQIFYFFTTFQTDDHFKIWLLTNHVELLRGL